mmetsp:Transcript_15478/g.33881  ORF Transcript_15478/g.33881 Transcript_15478/m.33881 type:complete len:708 (+) Transcript_15478:407-2530(+)
MTMAVSPGALLRQRHVRRHPAHAEPLPVLIRVILVAGRGGGLGVAAPGFVAGREEVVVLVQRGQARERRPQHQRVAPPLLLGADQGGDDLAVDGRGGHGLDAADVHGLAAAVELALVPAGHDPGRGEEDAAAERHARPLHHRERRPQHLYGLREGLRALVLDELELDVIAVPRAPELGTGLAHVAAVAPRHRHRPPRVVRVPPRGLQRPRLLVLLEPRLLLRRGDVDLERRRRVRRGLLLLGLLLRLVLGDDIRVDEDVLQVPVEAGGPEVRLARGLVAPGLRELHLEVARDCRRALHALDVPRREPLGHQCHVSVEVLRVAQHALAAPPVRVARRVAERRVQARRDVHDHLQEAPDDPRRPLHRPQPREPAHLEGIDGLPDVVRLLLHHGELGGGGLQLLRGDAEGQRAHGAQRLLEVVADLHGVLDLHRALVVAPALQGGLDVRDVASARDGVQRAQVVGLAVGQDLGPEARGLVDGVLLGEGPVLDPPQELHLRAQGGALRALQRPQEVRAEPLVEVQEVRGRQLEATSPGGALASHAPVVRERPAILGVQAVARGVLPGLAARERRLQDVVVLGELPRLAGLHQGRELVQGLRQARQVVRRLEVPLHDFPGLEVARLVPVEGPGVARGLEDVAVQGGYGGLELGLLLLPAHERGARQEELLVLLVELPGLHRRLDVLDLARGHGLPEHLALRVVALQHALGVL